MVPMEREISPLHDLISLARIWSVLRRIRPAICNAGTPKAALLVTVAAWLARIPVRIYTMRGLRLETAQGLKRFILSVTERIACACAHRVICVSPSLRDQAVKLNLVNKHKVEVLGRGSSNGVEVTRFVPTPYRLERAAAIRRALNLDIGQVIGFIGRFTPDKGISELVGAFDLLRQEYSDLSLLLIGSYEEGHAIDPGLRARIETGRGIVAIPFQADIAPYYLAMDVFVLPTYREGFPNTVLEAQAAERVVVTTMATGAVDSIVDGQTGMLVPARDQRALAGALRNVLTDPVNARRMGQAGRARVEREFSQEAVWAELGHLYRTLLRERGLPVPAAASAEGFCLQKA
jgi:glycosyltransferase involved in cell wall biosynthesis